MRSSTDRQMAKLLFFVGILSFLLRYTFVRALECRFAHLERYSHSRRHLRKKEYVITCEDENQVCARLHMEGKTDSKNISMHAASCLPDEWCEQNKSCPLGYLQDFDWKHPLTSLSFCQTKCCRSNHCNEHIRKYIPAGYKSAFKPQKGPKLRCYTGVVDRDINGVELNNNLSPKECFYGVRGHRKDRESRCMTIRAVARDSSTNLTVKTIQVSHCARTEMCDAKKMCEKVGITEEECNVTCCSAPLCNGANLFTVASLPLSLLTLLLAAHRVMS